MWSCFLLLLLHTSLPDMLTMNKFTTKVTHSMNSDQKSPFIIRSFMTSDQKSPIIISYLMTSDQKSPFMLRSFMTSDQKSPFMKRCFMTSEQKSTIRKTFMTSQRWSGSRGCVETVITKHTAATTRTLLHRSIGIKAFLLLERYQSTKYIKTSNLH